MSLLYLLLLFTPGLAAPRSRSHAAALEKQERLQRDQAMKSRGGLSEVAEWLVTSNPELGEAGVTHRQVLDGLMLLATAQQSLKSVDGLSHELSSALGKSNAQGFQDLLSLVLSAPARDVSLKKAARLRRNTALLKEAFEAAEVMHAMEGLTPAERRKRLKKAGYGPAKLEAQDAGPKPAKLRLPRQVSLEVAQREPGEVVLALGEVCTGDELLAMLSADPVAVRARAAPGAPWNVVHTNPGLLLEALAAFRDAWHRLRPFFPAGDAETQAGDDGAPAAKSEEGPRAAGQATDEGQGDAPSQDAVEPLLRRVNCVGHSAGGGVAALLACLLSGRVTLHPGALRPVLMDLLRTRIQAPKGKREALIATTVDELLQPLAEYETCVARTSRPAVRAVTFGCPPVLSAMAGDRFRLELITSFVNGDDLVPRASPSSLYRFKKRLVKAMPKGEGVLARSMAFGSWVGFGLVSDAANVAKQNLGELATGGVRRAPAQTGPGRGRQRRSQKLAEEVEAGDPTAVTMVVPGRLVYVKPRRAKNGATMSMLKAASVKRDIFWQLDDVFASKSMWRHHRLESYLRTLDRV